MQDDRRSFEITVHADRALIVARIAGFLSVADVEAFSVQEQAAIGRAGLADGYLLLVDTSDMVLQSQAVVAAFTRIVNESPFTARRLAIVIGSSLSRMQLRRVLANRDEARTFATRHEAETWLFDRPSPPHATAPVAPLPSYSRQA